MYTFHLQLDYGCRICYIVSPNGSFKFPDPPLSVKDNALWPVFCKYSTPADTGAQVQLQF